MDFDQRVFRYFLAVAEAGSMTAAAARLHITQPTLSRQIALLEEQLGATLFRRDGRQLNLTDAGFLFQQRVKEIMALTEKTRLEIAEERIERGGVVSVAVVESAASAYIIECLTRFSKRYPAVKFMLYSADGDDIREKLDRGLFELGVLLEPVETAKYDYLHLPVRDVWGLAVPAASELAALGSISTAEAAALPLIMPRRSIVIEEVAKWLGVSPGQLNIRGSHNLPTNGLLLVRNGLGCLISVRGALEIRPQEDIRFVPFSPEQSTGHVLAWRKNHRLSVAGEAFLKFVTRVSQNA